MKAFPNVSKYHVDLGGTYCNLGLYEAKPVESIVWFDRAIETLTAVYKKEPSDLEARSFLKESFRGRAKACDRLERHAEADEDWKEALNLSRKQEHALLRTERAYSRVRAGRIAEAVVEVAELTDPTSDVAQLDKWSAGQWYNVACIYAIASTADTQVQQEYRDKAVEMLRKAVKMGWKDAAQIAKDTDLDALRDRMDFKELVNSLY